MVYVFFAQGFEELEGLSPVDVLRRAGIAVTTVGVGGREITGSHGVTITCDKIDSQVQPEEMEMVVLPGAMPGTTNLEASPVVMSFLDYALAQKKWIAAICAAPSILGHRGILDGREAICFPGFEPALEKAVLSSKSVCVDLSHGFGVVTAKGAGVALEFALTLVACLKGKDAALALRKAMQCSE